MMTELQDPSFSVVTDSQLNEIVSEMYATDNSILQHVLAESQINTEMMVQDLSATGLHPCDKKWPGPYGFSLFVASESATRTSWVYSPHLTKVFIPITCILPVHFKYVWPETNLHVRALPVFLDMDDVPKPVVRCTYHLRDSKIDADKFFPFPAHVLRCEQTDSCYIEDPGSGRLSVVTPLSSPPPGTDHVVLHYKMMCKTSCLGGMNRRPIQIIFTLEFPTGEVVGRDTLKVRCCSCPKRDAAKEEEMAVKRQRSLVELAAGNQDQQNKMAAPPPSKKLKKPKLELGSYDHVIPLVGDRDYLVRCARILRANTVGDKMMSGQVLDTAEKRNLEILNQIIGEVPKVEEEPDDGSVSR